jgi:hypothetical protein
MRYAMRYAMRYTAIRQDMARYVAPSSLATFETLQLLLLVTAVDVTASLGVALKSL